MEIVLQKIKGFEGFEFANEQELLSCDFKKRGCYGAIPKYTYGGRKISDNFYSEKDGLLAVTIENEDILDENGIETDIEKTLKILYDNGEVFYKKTWLEPIKNRIKLRLSRYRNAFVHLQKTAEEHPSSQVRAVTSTLLAYYNNQINIWQNGNPQVFLDAMNNEPQVKDGQPNQIYYMLQAVVDSETGKRVLDGIVEQISGVKWKQ
ncbi:hypothetical protein PL373_13685 [Tenacibaculum maritimum]|nr:hypothetical protein [Tenacibaculum maritimum]MDB0602181.1 hypothetical protein [Tenacibaculum maritimum]MDB0613857.1 hypothetical protein [Tenacibaculum maritimum]